MKNRVGKFSISNIMLERNFGIVRSILSKCVVVRCEMMFANNLLEYVAISPEFDEIEPGKTIPEYEVQIGDNGKNIRFVKSQKMSEVVPHQKCIVKGCDNHSNHGEFVGNICKPCYMMLTTGKCGPVGNTFIHAMQEFIDEAICDSNPCTKSCKALST